MTHPWHIQLFGELRASRGGRTIDKFEYQKAANLLAYLAYHRGRPQSREILISHLWPESDPDSARNSLSRALWSLRRLLGCDDLPAQSILLATRAQVCLNPDVVVTDLAEFEEGLALAEQRAGVEQIETLETALARFDGPFLTGLYADWIEGARGRTTDQFVAGSLRLAEICRATGQQARVVECLRRLVGIDSLNESACLALMEALVATGNSAAAIREYRALEERLRDQLDIAPSEEVRSYLEAIRSQRNPVAVTDIVQGAQPPPFTPSPPAPADHSPHAGPEQAVEPKFSRRPRYAQYAAATGFVLCSVVAIAYELRHRAPLSGPIKPPTTLSVVTPLPGNAEQARSAAKASAPLGASLSKAGTLESSYSIAPMVVGTWTQTTPAAHPGPRPEGKQLWEQRYEAALGEGDSKPTAMTSDASGNVYVCGFVETVHNDTDFLTLKYAPKGQLIWSRRYNGPANDCDRARAIAVDSAGNVYVTGESYGGNRENGGTQWDFATVKYDSDGHEIWVRRFNGPPNCDDYATGVGVDANGNVYVAGTSRGTDGAAHYVLSKYDPTGRPLWTERNDPNPSVSVPSDCVLHDMTCDDRGNVYLTGEAVIQDGYGKRDTDYLTVCYDHNGNKIWQRRYSGDTNGVDKGWRISLDEDGSVYVAGQSEMGKGIGGAAAHVVLVKYDRNGKEVWTCPFRDPAGYGYPNGLTVGPGGNIYLSLLAGGLGGRQILLKVTPAGKLEWSHKFSDWLGMCGNMQGVAAAADSGVFCTGRCLDPAKGSGFWRGDTLTCRLNENGKLVWQRSYSEILNDGAGAHLVARDRRGNVIVASQAGLRWRGVPPIRFAILLLKYSP